MKRMVNAKSSEKVQKGHSARPTFWHLAAVPVAVLAMTCGAFLFDLALKKLGTIGASNANLMHIKIFAICMILLGMLLCDLLDCHEEQTDRETEQNEEQDGV